MKIKTKNHGIMHGIANCSDCDFYDSLNVEEKDSVKALKDRCKKHVQETGHEVNIEFGTWTTIYCEN